MSRISRRDVLKIGGARAVAAKTDGLAASLATGRTPAYAQTTAVHILCWNDFVPACDCVRNFSQSRQDSSGSNVNFETVNGDDLHARITPATQSGAGLDLVMLNNNHPHLYKASAVDMSDVAEEVGTDQAGFSQSQGQLLVQRQVDRNVRTKKPITALYRGGTDATHLSS
jgi:ABC-type glycerol-3-phosphate transport system substrate-binding protein